jgi:ATP adenylyltransferase
MSGFATTAQQPQSSPPTPHQLLLTYLTIHAASKNSTNRKRLLAFYNGGEGAGASQTWRHLQCIEVPRNEGAPIEEWVEDLEVERKGRSDSPGRSFSHISLRNPTIVLAL